MNLQSLCAQAALFLQRGNLAEAERLYVQVLGVDPRNFTACHLLGILRAQKGDYAEAFQLLGAALTVRPDDAAVLVHYANVLCALGRFDESLTSFDRALGVNPGDAGALFNRANALYELNRFADALADYDKTLALSPNFAEALINRGNSLREMGNFDAALESYNRALAIQPHSATALYNRGVMQWNDYRRYEAAVSDLEKTVLIDPDYEYARGELLHLRMHGADWRGFEQEKKLIDASVRAGKRVAKPFVYQAISDSPADLQACAQIYTAQYFPPAPVLWKKADRHHAKIRVGYVSGEFYSQATAYLAAGLYEAHDKSKFEIVAFDNGKNDNSATRKRLEAAFDKFVPISNLSDRDAAQKILDEEIDILVNLNGYFGALRMGVFAQRPAPIQVNYLGFPGTLGAGYIDYILADRIVVSEQKFYTENVVYLPDSYQVNDSRRHIAQAVPSRTEHGLPETGFVFCNFNVSYKLTPDMFAVWMRLLKQVDGSVLWMLESNVAFPANIRREAERHGVAASRLVFAPNIAVDAHLARLQLADLFLDTLPCNAHTTASDALWAGLPLVTCRGNAFSGRVAASLLQAIHLPELISESLEAYEILALKLAGNPALLQSIREKLAQNRLRTPLFDTARFRQHIEAAYTTMWKISQGGERPRGFSVDR